LSSWRLSFCERGVQNKGAYTGHLVFPPDSHF
jgi:hypothetical protein